MTTISSYWRENVIITPEKKRELAGAELGGSGARSLANNDNVYLTSHGRARLALFGRH
jgi:hypothetical protein